MLLSWCVFCPHVIEHAPSVGFSVRSTSRCSRCFYRRLLRVALISGSFFSFFFWKAIEGILKDPVRAELLSPALNPGNLKADWSQKWKHPLGTMLRVNFVTELTSGVLSLWRAVCNCCFYFHSGDDLVGLKPVARLHKGFLRGVVHVVPLSGWEVSFSGTNERKSLICERFSLEVFLQQPRWRLRFSGNVPFTVFTVTSSLFILLETRDLWETASARQWVNGRYSSMTETTEMWSVIQSSGSRVILHDSAQSHWWYSEVLVLVFPQRKIIRTVIKILLTRLFRAGFHRLSFIRGWLLL